MDGKNFDADAHAVACASKPASHEHESRRPVVVGHFVPREFLREIRADPTGFVPHFRGNLRSRCSLVGSGDPNGSNRPTADAGTSPLEVRTCVDSRRSPR
jgi:hypothetical protein